jgi:hypothetical protein
MRVFACLYAAAVVLPLALAGESRAEEKPVRTFPDRPVAWQEHDDADVRGAPETNHLQDLAVALALRDGLSGEIDRIMSLDSRPPAQDVNAADEVPCSTWYCARNHLHPMTPGQVIAGPGAPPPRLPLTITSGKSRGDALGFEVLDAGGRKYLLKMDIDQHLGLTTGAEFIGNAFFHAAGYNVAGAYLLEIDPWSMAIDRRATYLAYHVQHRQLTPEFLAAELDRAERLPDGRVRFVAVPWIQGQSLGGFDMKGTRPGDTNDRIPHQLRRSLRGSRILCAWLAVLDPGPANTLDTLVIEPNGRRFVRHNFIDFGSAFGSATDHQKGLHQEGEYSLEIGRTLAALFSFGIYQRPFQGRRAEFDALAGNYTAIGYFPAESFNPDTYRWERKNPAYMRMTDRDAYWGAKLVTSFTDAQIDAVVLAARLPDPDSTYLRHALKVRRDIIGRRYLRAMAAVEGPQVSHDGEKLCFDDLAVARGYVSPLEARYEVGVRDLAVKNAPAATTVWTEQAATGSRTCVPYGGVEPGSGYRIVEIRTRLAGAKNAPIAQLTKAARVHLKWRPDEGRFVVVGLERDE